MNFRKLIYITALILAAISCKKDEDTTITPSLDGTLHIVGLPEFISPGDSVTLTPKGATHPDGEPIEYRWKVLPSQVYDTTDVFGHRFADTLKTYTVYCYANASGYSGLSAVSYATVVAPGPDGSIQGVDYAGIADGCISDTPYYYKKIGDQTWTLNNLAAGAGIPFRNAEVMSGVFGRFYNFDEAKAACESLSQTNGKSWTLPTVQDWETLQAYISGNVGEEYGKTVAAAMMADAAFNGTDFWEYWPNVGDPKNGSGFSALPVGYANTKARSFKGDFEYASFWTATEVTETEAYYKYLICDQPEIFTGKGNKASYGASVRCILQD